MQAESYPSGKDQLISEVMVRIAPSPIHGVGIFAIRDIKAGEVIDRYMTRTVPITKHDLDNLPEAYRDLVNAYYAIHPGEITYIQHPNALFQYFHLMNHSAAPSVDVFTSAATRDIKAGEELFEDYLLLGAHANNWEFTLDDYEKIRR